MEKLLKKVEDLDSDERDKLRKMLTEKQSGGDKVDWLYKQDAPDDEEYLLGRRVDHHIDKTRHDDLKDVPGALFSVSDDVVNKRAEMDMQAKMREDPLYSIKQKEEDARNKLFQNPIKMKQIKALVAEREAANRKKEKKKKKKKKRRRSSSSSSDDELIAKYLAIVRNNEDRKKQAASERHEHYREERTGSLRDRTDEEHIKHRDRTDERSGRHRDRSRSVERYDPRRDRTDERHRDTSNDRHRRLVGDGSYDEESRRHKRNYGLMVKGEKTEHSRGSTAEERSHRSDKKCHKSRSEERSYRSRSKEQDESKSKHWRGDSRERKTDSRSTKDSKASRSSRAPPKKHEKKKPLSAEEMDQRRAAMQQNAQERDEQRKSNIERYRAEDEQEREQQEQRKGRGAQFVTPMMMEHAEQSSVEDRIKRNIYSIQRTKASLNKNFTRH